MRRRGEQPQRLPREGARHYRNDPILNPRDARREDLVIRIDGKALFLGIQVLLNAVGIFFCPFIGVTVSHKVIVGQVG